jgi:hypothetical protein
MSQPVREAAIEAHDSVMRAPLYLMLAYRWGDAASLRQARENLSGALAHIDTALVPTPTAPAPEAAE